MQEIGVSFKKPLNDMLRPSNLPLFCLIAIAFVAPLAGGQFELANSAGLYALALLGFLLLCVRSWGKPFPDQYRTVEHVALGVFLLLSLIACLGTVGADASLTRFLLLAGSFATFLLAAYVGRSGREWMPCVALAAAGVWIGVSGIAEYLVVHDEYRKLAGQEYRVFGSYLSLGFFNPGFFAGFLAMAAPVSLGLYCGSRRRWLTWLAGSAWLLQFSSLLLTGTRFGAIAFALATVCFVGFLALGKALSRGALIRLAVIAVLAVIPLVLFYAPMFSRVAAAGEQSHSFAFRLLTWQATIDMVEARPMQGFGPGAFHLAFPAYAIAGFTRLAHNSFLQIAAETGVPALIALLVGVGAAVLAALRGIRKRGMQEDTKAPVAAVPLLCGLLAGIAGSLARNLTDSDWYLPGISLVFWLFLGLASSVGRRMSVREPSPLVAGKWVSAAGIFASLALIAVTAVTYTAARYAANGSTAMENRDPAAADSNYSLACRLNPLSAQYKMKHALAVLARCGELSESGFTFALARAKEAARMEPVNQSVHMLVGNIEQTTGRYGAALAAYRAAEKRNPRSPSIKITVAETLEKMEKHQEAHRVYMQALAIEQSPYEKVRAIPELVDPSYAYAHFAVGDVYAQQGKSREAIREFEAVIERIDRRNKFSYMLKAQRAADSDGADDPRIANVWRESHERLAELYERQGDLSSSTRHTAAAARGMGTEE